MFTSHKCPHIQYTLPSAVQFTNLPCSSDRTLHLHSQNTLDKRSMVSLAAGHGPMQATKAHLRRKAPSAISLWEIVPVIVRNGTRLRFRLPAPKPVPPAKPRIYALRRGRPRFSGSPRWEGPPHLGLPPSMRRAYAVREALESGPPPLREDEDQRLPSLYASLAIEGLPPFHQNEHLEEAEAEIAKHAARWNIPSWEDCCRLSLFAASLWYNRAISTRRLVVITLHNAFVVMLDDLFFDAPDDDLLEGYGIDPSERESVERIQAFIDRLNGIFSQPEPPVNPSKVESIVWELGHDFRQLSTPDWFRHFAKTMVDYHQSCIDSLAHILEGNDVDLKDEDSYIRMRVDNVAGAMLCALTEFANNVYLPEELRSEPWAIEVVKAATYHIMLVNDIYSYHRECTVEVQPRNLITVLMKSEGMSLAQAVRRCLEVANASARTIFDLETQLVSSSLYVEPQPGDITFGTPRFNPLKKICPNWELSVGTYFVGIKECIAGNLHYHTLHKRYRHPDSYFPELKGVNHRKVQMPDLLLVSEFATLKIVVEYLVPETNT